MTSSSHRTLKAFRTLHLYLGAFTAPALLFFAFTGALQTFSLHETTRGSTYEPPRWAVVLGQIHKKQTPVVAPKRPQPVVDTTRKPNETKPPESAHDAHVQPVARQHHPLPMKIFFLIVAIALALSTLTGIYMAYKFARNKRVITALLLLGALIPLLLVMV